MPRTSIHLLVGLLRIEWEAYKPPLAKLAWLDAAVRVNGFVERIRQEQPDERVGTLLEALEAAVSELFRESDNVSTTMAETTWQRVDAALEEYLRH